MAEQTPVALSHDTHPVLTEPVLHRHLINDHGWTAVSAYSRTYFQLLIAHRREHIKAQMAVTA